MKAAIDIGSNSLLLTIVDPGGVDSAGAIVHDEARVVGLGKGLGDGGQFRADRIAAADAVLDDYAAVARRHGIDPATIAAVATSGARRASNAEAWFAAVERRTGIRVRTISGDEEARLTWLGATRDLTVPAGLRAVIDLGGGSTEVVLGDDDRIASRRSLEIGTVRLTELHLAPGGAIPDRFDPAGLAALEAHVDREAATLVIPGRPGTVIGVAGSVTTLAAIHLGLTRYDPARVHGATLTRGDLGRFVAAFATADAAGRRRLAAVSPDRADLLLAGAVVLDRLLAALDADALVASDRGLRFALLG
ncbi:MAG: Ppx/GppA family phosphatase [Myxococcota bacterium]